MLQDDGGRDEGVPEVLGWLLAAAAKPMPGSTLEAWLNPIMKVISGRAGWVQVALASSQLLHPTQVLSPSEVSFICPSSDRSNII